MNFAGLRVLVAAHAHVKNEPWQLAITPGGRAVQAVFDITGTVEQPAVHLGPRAARSPQ